MGYQPMIFRVKLETWAGSPCHVLTRLSMKPLPWLISIALTLFAGAMACTNRHAPAAPDAARAPELTKAAEIPDDGKLRIIVFGAHPDDSELKAGGSAAKWARQGHHVELVSVTNGDIGHWQIHGEPLAQRRLAEVRAADKVL